MAGMKNSELEFLRLLPSFMRGDEAVIALSKAMDDLLGTPAKRINTIRTWDMIDELTEAECDELAWELDIDWYDSTGMNLTEKRETIKSAQQIKAKRGTKWAVERLITAYFGEGYVMEWFDMDGDPFTFAALTTNTEITAENLAKFTAAAEAAKNERSHIVGVFYYWPQGPEDGIQFAIDSKLHRYNFVKCGTRPRRATLGILIKPSIETEPEATLHRYDFTHAGEQICGTYPRPGTLGAIVKDGIASEGLADMLRYNFKRKAGTYPRPGTLGQKLQQAIEASAAADAVAYSFTRAGAKTCGTYPAAATLGATVSLTALTEPDATLYAYSFVHCGTRRCGQ